MRIKSLAKFAAALFGVVVLSNFASADTVFFSSFEGTYPGSSASGTNYSTYSSGATIDGWTVGGDGVDIISDSNSPPDPSYAPAPYPDGTHSVDLNALGNGSLTRTVTLTPGTTYDLTFFLSVNASGTSSGTTDLQVSVNGVAGPVVPEQSNTSWALYNYGPFTVGPGSGSTTISFTSIAPPGAAGPAIDAITLASTPLPSAATAGLGLFGLTAITGIFARRRSAKSLLAL